MEPPSDELLMWLQKLGLCSSRELGKCRSRVRALAQDLPTFDSVWIDALVQIRKLTPFQAERLEQNPASLQVGPCLLMEALGERTASRTFLGREQSSNTEMALKCVSLSDYENRERAELFSQLEQLVSSVNKLRHPGLSPIESALQHDENLILLSRYVPGWTLAELLIRRGRFQGEVGLSLTRQVLHALSLLEQVRVIHGDLSLKNIRLTSEGRAVLVDIGVKPLLQPMLDMSDLTSPERYDGIAPERIATTQQSTSASDCYSLGCLLWQLMAGRPPFPTGDALSKLAAHQTTPIPALEEYAPETPKELLELIEALTTKDVELRPASFQHLSRQFGKPHHSDQRTLKRFLSQFSKPVHILSSPNKAPRRIPIPNLKTAMLLLLLASGFGWMNGSSPWNSIASLWAVPEEVQTEKSIRHQTSRSPSNTDLSSQVASHQIANAKLPDVQSAFNLNTRMKRNINQLSPAKENSESLEQVAATRLQESTQLNNVSSSRFDSNAILLPIPEPNPQGIIYLKGKARYSATAISSVGPVAITCMDHSPAIIEIDEASFHTRAEQVTLKNIQFEFSRNLKNGLSQSPASMVMIESQDLLMENCRFHRSVLPENRDQRGRRHSLMAMAWKPLESADQTGTAIAIERTVFIGPGVGITLAHLPTSCTVKQTLKVGTEPLFVLFPAEHPSTTPGKIRLDHVTLRESGSLLRCYLSSHSDNHKRMRLVIETVASVFHLHSGQTSTPLVEFISPQLTTQDLSSLQIQGESTLANAPLLLAGWKSHAQASMQRLPETSFSIEGVLAAPFQFQGGLSREPVNSTLKSFEAPIRSSQTPGIDASLFE